MFKHHMENGEKTAFREERQVGSQDKKGPRTSLPESPQGKKEGHYMEGQGRPGAIPQKVGDQIDIVKIMEIHRIKQDLKIDQDDSCLDQKIIPPGQPVAKNGLIIDSQEMIKNKGDDQAENKEKETDKKSLALMTENSIENKNKG